MTDSSAWATPGTGNAAATGWNPHGPGQPAGHRPYYPHAAGGHPARPRPVDETRFRPTYRETHRSTPAGVFAGAAVTVLWFGITVFLGIDLTSRLWVMLAAASVATGAAFLLARYGDRGAAAGVASVSGVAVAVVGLVVELQHLLYETWVLW